MAREDQQVVVRSPPKAAVRTRGRDKLRREFAALARGQARSSRWAPLDTEMNRFLRKAEGDLEGPRAGHCINPMHTAQQHEVVS